MLCAGDATLPRVCRETIYQRICEGALGLQPAESLRSRRRRRKYRNARYCCESFCSEPERCGVAGRQDLTDDELAGNWEGDSIVRARSRSVAIRIGEVSSGLQISYQLGNHCSAAVIALQLADWIKNTPAAIRR